MSHTFVGYDMNMTRCHEIDGDGQPIRNRRSGSDLPSVLSSIEDFARGDARMGGKHIHDTGTRVGEEPGILRADLPFLVGEARSLRVSVSVEISCNLANVGKCRNPSLFSSLSSDEKSRDSTKLSALDGFGLSAFIHLDVGLRDHRCRVDSWKIDVQVQSSTYHQSPPVSTLCSRSPSTSSICASAARRSSAISCASTWGSAGLSSPRGSRRGARRGRG